VLPLFILPLPVANPAPRFSTNFGENIRFFIWPGQAWPDEAKSTPIEAKEFPDAQHIHHIRSPVDAIPRFRRGVDHDHQRRRI
jgi:hypothetical protein